MGKMNSPVRIRRYLDIVRSASQPSALRDAIDAIFFAASNTQSFSGADERQAFRERWLGRYLSEQPQFAYLVVDADDGVIGYLVGSLEPPTPDTNPFKNFRDLTSRFPAHLHVNVAPESRSQGYGGKLIDVFVTDLRKANIRGAHVVTAAQSENVRFYNRHKFLEIARLSATPALVFLGRAL